MLDKARDGSEKRQQRAKEEAATARVQAARVAQAAGGDPHAAAAAAREAEAAVAAAATGEELDARLGPAMWEGVRIAGAKTYPDREGVHILLRWPDNYGAVVPSRDLQMPGRAHCMRSLIAFFESKIKKRGKAEGGGAEAEAAPEGGAGGGERQGGGDSSAGAAAEAEPKGEAAAGKANPRRQPQRKKPAKK